MWRSLNRSLSALVVAMVGVSACAGIAGCSSKPEPVADVVFRWSGSIDLAHQAMLRGEELRSLTLLRQARATADAASDASLAAQTAYRRALVNARLDRVDEAMGDLDEVEELARAFADDSLAPTIERAALLRARLLLESGDAAGARAVIDAIDQRVDADQVEYVRVVVFGGVPAWPLRGVREAEASALSARASDAAGDFDAAGLAWTDAARTADFRVRAERLLSAARSFAAAGDAAQAATLAMLSARAFDRLDLSADEAIEAYTLARDSAERAGLGSVVVRAKAGLAEARRVLMSQR